MCSWLRYAELYWGGVRCSTHTFCAWMTKARGLKIGLKSSFFPAAWEGGGTGRAWVESRTAEAFTSFSARYSQASRKSTQLPEECEERGGKGRRGERRREEGRRGGKKRRGGEGRGGKRRRWNGREWEGKGRSRRVLLSSNYRSWCVLHVTDRKQIPFHCCRWLSWWQSEMYWSGRKDHNLSVVNNLSAMSNLSAINSICIQLWKTLF